MRKIYLLIVGIFTVFLGACGVFGGGLEGKLNTEEGFYHYDEEDEFLTIFHFDVEDGEGTVTSTEYSLHHDGEEVVIDKTVEDFPVTVDKDKITMVMILPISANMEGNDLRVTGLMGESDILFKKASQSKIDEQLALLESKKEDVLAEREAERLERELEEKRQMINMPINHSIQLADNMADRIDSIQQYEESYNELLAQYEGAKQALEDSFTEPFGRPNCHSGGLENVELHYCDIQQTLDDLAFSGSDLMSAIDNLFSDLDMIDNYYDEYNETLEELPELKDEDMETIQDDIQVYRDRREELTAIKDEVEQFFSEVVQEQDEMDEKYIQ